MSPRTMRRARQRDLEREARQERRRGGTKLAAGAGAALGTTVLFAPAADAATFTVTNLNDAGAGSLRQAVIDGNADAAADQVVFQSGLTGTITLTTGQINILEPLSIQGPGASTITVDGDDSSRIFYVDPNTDDSVFSISGLMMANGYAGDMGGALNAHSSVLTVTDAVFSGNAVDSDGGAVAARETTLTIENSTFTGNRANDGGALYTAGDVSLDPPVNDVVISDSTFVGNSAAGNAGAIFIGDDTDGGVLIERSAIAGNESDADVGGIIFEGPDADGTGEVVVRETTISGNTADSDIGGISVYGMAVPVRFQNVTVSGNRAITSAGVGVVNYYEVPVSFENSTIVQNVATGPGGGIYHFNEYGGEPDTVKLSSTVVADNSAPTGPDLFDEPMTSPGTFELGFSLVENTTGASTTESPAGSNLLGVDPLLGPLADNGGPTQTHLPQLSSPVLEAGIANGLATDQRGEARSFDATNVANKAGSDATDIGAAELAASGTCKGKAATMLFAPGLKINGSSGNDVIVGTDQKDKINSGGGKDTVCAGAGNDTVNGGGGKDNLNGERGKDTLKGGGGKDKLKGGPGKDKLRGGPGKDKLKGGGGKDSEVQ